MLLAHHVVEPLRAEPICQRRLPFQRLCSGGGEEIISHRRPPYRPPVTANGPPWATTVRSAGTPAVVQRRTTLDRVSSAEPIQHEVGTFTDVVGPADDYRAGHPIVVNVVADRDTGRRIIDFMSGLAYGTGGTLEKAAEKLYLLTPPLED